MKLVKIEKNKNLLKRNCVMRNKKQIQIDLILITKKEHIIKMSFSMLVKK
jgi:hypothetical protein